MFHLRLDFFSLFRAECDVSVASIIHHCENQDLRGGVRPGSGWEAR